MEGGRAMGRSPEKREEGRSFLSDGGEIDNDDESLIKAMRGGGLAWH